MITKDHELSISAQARLLNISRSMTYYTPRPPSAQDLTLMRQLDELHLKHPTLGSRMLRDQLNRMGYHVGRRHVSTLMKKMGMMPVSCQRQTSIKHRGQSDLSLWGCPYKTGHSAFATSRINSLGDFSLNPL